MNEKRKTTKQNQSQLKLKIMAIPAAIVAAGVQTGGNLLNMGLQGIQNSKDKRWNEKMFNWQRDAALTDWAMQNAYNSPAAQMQRLKDAGLNPNLVYGNGATATSETMPKPASPGSPNTQPLQFDAGSVLGAYYDAQIKEAQTDNLKAQKTVMEQDALLRAAQIIQTNTGVTKTQQEIKQSSDLFATTLEAAKANVRKIQADTDYTIDQNKRMQELQPATLKKLNEEINNYIQQRRLSAEQIREIKQRVNNLVTEGKLKEWELKARRDGINPNDPTWMKALYYEIIQPLLGIGTEKKSVLEQFKEGFKRNNKAALDTIKGTIRKGQRKMGEYFNQIPPHY